MAHYDVYGLGNALVDTEYHVSDALLEALGVEKGMMTLIDDSQDRKSTRLNSSHV